MTWTEELVDAELAKALEIRFPGDCILKATKEEISKALGNNDPLAEIIFTCLHTKQDFYLQ